MNNCKDCQNTEPCKYSQFEESCQNCQYNSMLFDVDDDPCNTCECGSNFVLMSEYRNE